MKENSTIKKIREILEYKDPDNYEKILLIKNKIESDYDWT